MAKIRTAWGIDIGQCAMKAIKLADLGDGLEVDDFEIIEHPEILSQPDVDKELLIRQSLEQFLATHVTKGSTIVLSVPGQSSFTRFFKPPPVEPKELPRIVQYEAAQQIPFAIDEVVWRWQAFQDEASPELEVGIFAMKRVDIAEMLNHLTDVGMHTDIVQVAPLALYNFMTFDEQVSDEGATLLVDVGADKTDLVVSDGARIWNRTVQIGGNNFTEALARAFKLSFDKAEKLKRTAATSKYARQVFQAMRPVFEDLVQEIQRSVGYYISLHRETQFKRLLGLGNGFKLPGLQKFLEQNLNIPVARLDSFHNLSPADGVNVPGLAEGTLSFGVAYGLAAQALRPTRVMTNLLPGEIARRRLWATKVPWFIAAAVLLVLTLLCPTGRAMLDRQELPDMANNPSVLADAKSAVGYLKGLQTEYRRYQDAGRDEEEQIKQYLGMFGYRDFWPSAESVVMGSLRAMTGSQDREALSLLVDTYYGAEPSERAAIAETIAGLAMEADRGEVRSALETPEGSEQRQQIVERLQKVVIVQDVQRLLAMYGEATTADQRQDILDRIKLIPRAQRHVVFVDELTVTYHPDLARAIPTAANRPTINPNIYRGFEIQMSARTPMNYSETVRWLDQLKVTGEQIADGLPSVTVLYCHGSPVAGQPPVEVLPGEALSGPRESDPTFPDEDTAGDTLLPVTWLLAITGDGLPDGPTQQNP